MGLGLDPSSGMGLLRNLGAGRGPPADFFMSAVCAPKPLGSAGTLGKAGDCGIKLPRDACQLNAALAKRLYSLVPVLVSVKGTGTELALLVHSASIIFSVQR